VIEEHTNEANGLSLKEKDERHAQTKGLYAHRAFGRDCYYRVIAGDIDACAAEGQETGEGRCMSIAPQAMVHCLVDVSGRSRWLVSSGLGAGVGGIFPEPYLA
jgi:hypothetical protein